MNVAIFLLFISGALNLVLGVMWNIERQKMTGVYSRKYKTVWIIGLTEIVVSIAFLALPLLDY